MMGSCGTFRSSMDRKWTCHDTSHQDIQHIQGPLRPMAHAKSLAVYLEIPASHTQFHAGCFKRPAWGLRVSRVYPSQIQQFIGPNCSNNFRQGEIKTIYILETSRDMKSLWDLEGGHGDSDDDTFGFYLRVDRFPDYDPSIAIMANPHAAKRACPEKKQIQGPKPIHVPYLKTQRSLQDWLQDESYLPR